MASVQLGKFEILQLFKDNTLKFFDSLIELFPEESDLIVARILFENQIPIEESLTKLTKRIIPHEDNIKARNEKIFLSDDNPILFNMNKDKVIRWRSLWKSSRLDKQDREAMWKW